MWLFRAPPLGVSSPSDLADLTLTTSIPGDGLGLSLSIRSDFDGDGLGDILVGSAYGASENGLTNPGAVYIVPGNLRGSRDPTKVQSYTFYGAEHEDFFGLSAAPIGDINGDDVPEVAVGSPYWGPALQGAAFLFSSPFGEATLTEDATTTIFGDWWDIYHYCNPPPVILCETIPKGSQTGMGIFPLGDVFSDPSPDFGLTSLQSYATITDGGITGNVEVNDSGLSMGTPLLTVTPAGDLDQDGRQDFYRGGYDTSGFVEYCHVPTSPEGTSDRLRCHVVYREPVPGLAYGALHSDDLTQDGVPDLLVGRPALKEGDQYVGGVVVVSGADIVNYLLAIEAL